MEGHASLLPSKNPADPDLPRRGPHRAGDPRLGSDHPLVCPGPRRARRHRGSCRRPADYCCIPSIPPGCRPAERQALADHASKLNTAIGQFQRADTFSRYYYAGLGLVILLAWRHVHLCLDPLRGHLSRQLSRPIEELIGWTGNIRRMEPLPPDRPRRGAPEFAALRTALREMASALERARSQEIEAERLRAFRETARRVAHEMRNPLTPMRLAVAQLARSGADEHREAIEVLAAESDRLEQLAREFTEFGRLPEGPAAPVDFTELLAELARTSLPPTMKAR